MPDSSGLRELLLTEHHDVGIAGHFGVGKTLLYLQRQYYWPNMKVFVKNYINSCEFCQRNKSSNQAPAGFLQPLEIPSQKWQSVSMDFIVALPTTERGFDAVITVVDRLTKMVHYIPTTTNATALDTARLFFSNVVALHGVPINIVSDRDPKFISAVWSALWEMMGTKLSMSTAYHPQSDGQSEILNRILEDMLRTFCATDHHNNWDLHLKTAKVVLRVT